MSNVSNVSTVSNAPNMSNMLNVFACEGIVSTEVELEYDEIKRVSKASFHLKNTVRTGKKAYTNDFYVVIYGKKAEDCYAKLSVGKQCSVSGTISTWYKVDELGNKTSGAVINATNISCN